MWGGGNAQRGSPNDFMSKSVAGVDEIILPTQTDVIHDRVKVAVHYPGATGVMNKKDLTDYYPTFNRQPFDSLVLVSGVSLEREDFGPWTRGEPVFRGGEVHEPADREPRLASSEASIHLLMFLLHGMFEAQLMHHIAHISSAEGARLTKMHPPNALWMNETIPFPVKVYVDDYFRVEPKMVNQPYLAKLCNRRMLFEILG